MKFFALVLIFFYLYHLLGMKRNKSEDSLGEYNHAVQYSTIYFHEIT